MAEFGIGGHDRLAQGFDHFGFDIVRQVTPCLRGRHLAPAIEDFFLFGLRVVDTGKCFDVLLKHAGQFARCCLALGAVLFGQQVQGALDVQLFAVHRKGQPGDGFVEKTLPRVADNAQIVQEFFQLVRQLIGLHRADAPEHGLVSGKIRVGSKMRPKHIVFDPVDLEREKHQRRGENGDLFLHVRQELGAIRIGGQLIIPQAGKGHDTARDGVDLFIALNARQKGRSVQLCQLAFIVGSKGGTFAFQPVQVARQFGRLFRGVEIRQIPFGKIAQIVGTAQSQWGALFAELGLNVSEAPPVRPAPLTQDGLLDLFDGSDTGAGVTLEPATDADMRGKYAKPKQSLEVIYDDA